MLCLVQALQQQMTELETKLVQARTDSKAQVKGHNTGRKEMEVRSLTLTIMYCKPARVQCCASVCTHKVGHAQARL